MSSELYLLTKDCVFQRPHISSIVTSSLCHFTPLHIYFYPFSLFFATATASLERGDFFPLSYSSMPPSRHFYSYLLLHCHFLLFLFQTHGRGFCAESLSSPLASSMSPSCLVFLTTRFSLSLFSLICHQKRGEEREKKRNVLFKSFFGLTGP